MFIMESSKLNIGKAWYTYHFINIIGLTTTNKRYSVTQ